MVKKSVNKWEQAAESLKVVRGSFGQPMHVIIAEAIDLARFVKTYWEPVAPSAGVRERPGLSTVKERIPSTTADDLVSQAEALQAAQSAYVLSVAPIPMDLRERAEFLVNELSAALEFLFDDGVEDESDQQLAKVKQVHANTPDSVDALAAELADYAELANRHADELVKIAHLDKQLITEAHQLVRKLRDRTRARPTADAVSVALEKRDRIATLLYEHVARIRSGARYVFRHHPDIVRQATSSYERRRRAEARRASRKSAGEPGEKSPAEANGTGENATS